jgi:ribosomal protein L11 methylase PrmA
MKPIYQELTLKNVLADPMVRLAMDADNVDPQELVAMFAGIAKKLEQSPRSMCQQAC